MYFRSLACKADALDNWEKTEMWD